MSTPIDLKSVAHSLMTDQLAAQVKRAAASQATDDPKLRTACADFEAILVNRMLEVMRSTLRHDGLLDGGTGREITESLYYQEIATRVTRAKGLGIGERLYRQMAERAGAVPTPSQGAENPRSADKQ
ncbi:MAG: rod-binding protein [Desulfobacterales bacterium]|nr:rod-binding protein [Desulfobacterales bacterium]